MTSFDPFAPSSVWYLAWRQHIRCAKANPSQMIGYCRAALIAQSEFVQYQALELNKQEKLNGPTT